MNKFRKICSVPVFTVLLSISNSFFSQAAPCAETEAFKAFDFWVGEWGVSNDADGSVRQFFQQYNGETKNWDTWFDGRYVHKP